MAFLLRGQGWWVDGDKWREPKMRRANLPFSYVPKGWWVDGDKWREPKMRRSVFISPLTFEYLERFDFCLAAGDQKLHHGSMHKYSRVQGLLCLSTLESAEPLASKRAEAPMVYFSPPPLSTLPPNPPPTVYLQSMKRIRRVSNTTNSH